MIHGKYDLCANCYDIKINDKIHHLDHEEAVKLLQVLWDMNIRPRGVEAEMAATKLHLQDMRRLVFGNDQHQPSPRR